MDKMCLGHIHPYSLAQTPLCLPTHLPHNFMSFFFFKKIITHWVLFVDARMHIGIDSSTGVWLTYQWTPHNERESPSPCSHQLLIAPQLVVGLGSPFMISVGFLTRLVLVRWPQLLWTDAYNINVVSRRRPTAHLLSSGSDILFISSAINEPWCRS